MEWVCVRTPHVLCHIGPVLVLQPTLPHRVQSGHENTHLSHCSYLQKGQEFNSVSVKPVDHPLMRPFDLPKETTPSFDLPKETTPSFDLPKETTPSFDLPKETTPSFDLPKETTSDLYSALQVGCPLLSSEFSL